MRERGGALGRVLLGIALIGVVIAGLVALTGIYIARNVNVETTETGRGKSIRVSTPAGSVNIRAGERLDPAAIGVPAYPDARPVRESGKSAEIDLDLGSEHKDLGIQAGEFTTADPPERVASFYRERLPHWIFSKGRRGKIEIRYSESGYKRIIAIQRKNGETRISVVAIGERAVN
jgi:hypothetical protein